MPLYVAVVINAKCLSLFRISGRPRVQVNMDEVELLRSLRFSFTDIAEVLDISRATLYRRLQEEGLSSDCTYSDISDNDLDDYLIKIKHNHPNDGERLLAGHLCQLGIIVPRSWLRSSIHRVDPENTAIRRSITVRRRVYNVAGPNMVWHVDGNHKLIRWRFVIHGAIDGFSRLVLFLKCSNNNRATTMLSHFTSAVDIHGLPTRIRTDLGGENVEIWRYMIEQHNSLSAVVTGSSTHNERIERLWRDVFRCVGSLFYDTFYNLENRGQLNPLNEVDLFCLHYVYLPRLNTVLQEFTECWNNHNLSTEGNLTPNQLFIRGAIEQNIYPSQPQLLHSSQGLGDADQSVLPNEQVSVPRIQFKPCDDLQTMLSGQINPIQHSDQFATDLYDMTVNTVGNHLSGNCNNCQ